MKYICILTYLLIYSMEQRSSWDAITILASQEVSAFHGTRMFITAVAKARHLFLS
jgi:hypothetical protein